MLYLIALDLRTDLRQSSSKKESEWEQRCFVNAGLMLASKKALGNQSLCAVFEYVLQICAVQRRAMCPVREEVRSVHDLAFQFVDFWTDA